MRPITIVGAALILTAAGTACDRGTASAPSAPTLEARRDRDGASARPPKNFAAHLAGASEVPVRETRGVGQFKLQLSADGTLLEYRLISSNIENVFASHIHVAPEGVNGPIVAFLFGPAPVGGGRTNGVLARGTITAADLIGPLEGHPLSDLIDAMLDGNAYANVHTNDGVDPANTGPGDFPGGEIRGQIRALGGR